MHKKLLASAALILLLVLASGTAWAAYCTACGVSISDSAHLCPRCGARQMPESSGLAITRIFRSGSGEVTVSWSGGAGPYTLRCVQKLSGDISADLASSACMGFQDASANVIDGHSGTADLLIPGQDYWIFVFDAKGRFNYQAWIPGQAPDFTAIPVSMSLQLQSRCGDVLSVCTAFSAGEIAACADTAFGARILADVPPGGVKAATILVCITAPNGAIWADDASDIYMPGSSSDAGLPFYDMTGYFRQAADRFGCIPTGVYTCSLYLDGMHAGSQTFRVTD